MAVREATIDDLGDVLDCWCSLLDEQSDHGSLLDPESNRSPGRQLLAAAIVDGRVLVADEGDVVGIATVRLDEGALELREPRGVVETLFVRPHRRNEGIGTELLTAAERSLRERGCTVVTVEVLAANERARQFYADRGYDVHRTVLQREVESDTKPADEG